MKKSNKILLGSLLTIILVLVAVHVALYARYKAGNYVTYTDGQTEEATQVNEFPNARTVQLRNIPNVVVRMGNKMKVEQYGEKKGNVNLVEQGGNLIVAFTDTLKADHMFNYVILYVPEGSTINSYKSYVRVEGVNGKGIGNLNFNSTGGNLSFQQMKGKLPIDSLNIVATNDASVELQNVQINKLALQLNASEFIDKQADIKQLNLNADTTSRINLQSKNLLQILTKTTAHE